jgi:hypothetical protein
MSSDKNEEPFSVFAIKLTLMSVDLALKHKLPEATVHNVVGAGLGLAASAAAQETFTDLAKDPSPLSENHLRRNLEKHQKQMHMQINRFTEITGPVLKLDKNWPGR